MLLKINQKVLKSALLSNLYNEDLKQVNTNFKIMKLS